MHIRFTATNRPRYFKKVIDSWNSVRGISQVSTYAHVEPTPARQEMLDIFFDIESKSATAVLNETRNGVLVNPWEALNDGFQVDDYVILAEDDIVVSDDILEYFDSARQLLTNKSLGVCAFTRQGGKPYHVERRPSFSPLVWATTKEMWEKYLKDSWDKDYSSGNPDGTCAGWDHNINRILAREEMHFITPMQSRSDHIGEIGGTHMVPELFESSRGVDFKKQREPTLYYALT